MTYSVVGTLARIKHAALLLWLSSGLVVFLPSFLFAQGSIILPWEPSSNTNVSGYNVYYGVSSGDYTNKIPVGNFTNTIISGLIEGETYYFAATAYDSSGTNESDYSNEILYTVPTNGSTNPPPPPPIVLPAIASAQGSIILTWDPSSGNNVSGYNVYYGVSSGVYTSKISVGNFTNSTISGLAAGGTYYFVATAYDSSGDESAFSDEILYTVPPGSTNTPPSAPPAPFGLQSTAIAQGSIILAWQPSSGANASGYNVYYGVSSRVYTNKVSVGNFTNTTISGLIAGKTYYFAATAYDSSGDESDFSDELLYTVPSQGSTNPPPSSNIQSGVYNGLFSEQDAVQLQSAGSFKLSVTSRRGYSGSLQLGKTKSAFSGMFGTSVYATNRISRKNANSLLIVLDMSARGQVNGSVSDGTWTASLYGEQSGFPTSNSVVSGKYTFVIPGKMQVASSLGNGYGTMTLSTIGAVSFAGTLGDGTKLSQSSSSSVYGNWPLYVPLYSGGGMIMGWVTLTNSGNPMGGSFNWIRPAGSKPLTYQDGFAMVRRLAGTLYIPGTNPIPNPLTANLQLGGEVGTITNNGKILKLKFSQSTGIFNGQIDNPNGKPLPFQGAYLQSVNAGYGFIPGTNVSSPVILTP